REAHHAVAAWRDHRLRASSVAQTLEQLRLVMFADGGHPARAAGLEPLDVTAARVHDHHGAVFAASDHGGDVGATPVDDEQVGIVGRKQRRRFAGVLRAVQVELVGAFESLAQDYLLALAGQRHDGERSDRTRRPPHSWNRGYWRRRAHLGLAAARLFAPAVAELAAPFAADANFASHRRAAPAAR